MSSISNINNIDVALKQKASCFEKFQYWLARKVVISKSWFCTKITAVFEKILPYFKEVKEQLEVQISELKSKKITQIAPPQVDPAKSQPVQQAASKESAIPNSKAIGSAPSTPSSSEGPQLQQDQQADEIALDDGPVSIAPSSAQPAQMSHEEFLARLKKIEENAQSAMEFSINILMTKQRVPGFVDLSWPIRAVWNKCFKTQSQELQRSEKEDSDRLEKQELQLAIEDQSSADQQSLSERIKAHSFAEEAEKLKAEYEEIEKHKGIPEYNAKTLILSEKMQQLIQKQAKTEALLNTELPNGKLPLHYAIELNQPAIVEELIALGARSLVVAHEGTVSLKRDKMGNTALDYVALSGNPAIKASLVKHFQNQCQNLIGLNLKNVVMSSNRSMSQENVLELVEVNLLSQIDAIHKNLASRPTVDPLAISGNDMARFGAAISMFMLTQLFDTLNSKGWSHPEANFFASYTLGGLGNLIRFAGLVGGTAEVWGRAGDFMNFLNGTTNFDNPFLLYTAMNLCEEAFPIVGYATSALGIAIMASSVFDLLNTVYKNPDKRPWDIVKKLTVTGVNITTRSLGYFPNPLQALKAKIVELEKKIKNAPYVKTIAELSEKLPEKIANCELASKTCPLKNDITTLVSNDPDKCKKAFRRLGLVFHPDKNGTVEEFVGLSSLNELFCKA